MEALQMLKFAFMRGRGLNFMAGTSPQDIEAYLKEAMAGTATVTEDINMYIQGLFS